MRALVLISACAWLCGCELVVNPRVADSNSTAGATGGTTSSASSSSASSSGSSGTHASSSSGSSGTSSLSSSSASSSASSSSSGSSSSSSGSSTGVSGTVIDEYVVASESHPTLAPVAESVTARHFGAVVIEGDGGTEYFDGGFGDDAGNFSIDGVPAGAYLLRDGTTTIATARHTSIDLGVTQTGRPDQNTLQVQTLVNFDVGGFTAIASGDRMQLIALNDSYELLQLQRSLTFTDGGSAPLGGDTLQGELDWRNFSSGHGVDPDAGDTLFLVQLQEQDAGVTDAGALTLYVPLAFADLTSQAFIQEGSAVNLSATAQPILDASTHALDVTYTRALSFESDLPAGSSFRTTHVEMDALPLVSTQGAYFNYPPNLFTAYSSSEGLTSIAFTHARPLPPYPSTWQQYVCFTTTFGVSLAQVSITQLEELNRCQLLDVTAPITWTPSLGPVRNVTLNGMDASIPQTSVNGTALIAWDPPRGTAHVDAYTITLNKVTATGAIYAAKTYATYRIVSPAAGPQVALFTGLSGGSSAFYYFTIEAVSASTADFSRGPLRSVLPIESSSISSQTFGP